MIGPCSQSMPRALLSAAAALQGSGFDPGASAVEAALPWMERKEAEA
eukprot:CAMPEP_0170647950 /NCGR_PEP_ID=MMETSP0224-20130122/44465_1 /TAXON_ID=285029 /ORGANISM="Togula jolla, Strain CCCM 725" /LENGTH=46 /DNA_ID= /DNA_START= /DNA_END= /DNA_ORIENTATION=